MGNDHDQYMMCCVVAGYAQSLIVFSLRQVNNQEAIADEVALGKKVWMEEIETLRRSVDKKMEGSRSTLEEMEASFKRLQDRRLVCGV